MESEEEEKHNLSSPSKSFCLLVVSCNFFKVGWWGRYACSFRPGISGESGKMKVEGA